MASTEKDKAEKQKINNQIKHVPKDAQVIMSILKDLGVTDYEPRVINQLLEFTYRYVTCLLDDAKVYANHAKKKTIDLEDFKLATIMVLDKAFTGAPPREVIRKLAEIRNQMPLVPVKPHCGLRLPPDRYCLSACNYKLRAAAQPKKMTKSAIEPRSNLKIQLKPQPMPSVKRPVPAANFNTPKSQVVTIPKPVFKFTPKPAQTKSGSGDNSKSSTTEAEVKMEVDDSSAGGDKKRKREEDDFEIVP